MIVQIIKRDGRQVEFNKDKIRKAMIAAFNEEYLGKSDYSSRLFKYERLIEEVQHKVEEFATHATIGVEQIQDFIIDNLKNVEPLVAVRYKKYRDSRTAIREKETDKYKEALDKINAKNIQSNNANVDDACFTGRQKGFQEVYYKAMMLDEMPELYANNHIENLSYIHDLDSYGLVHNCLSLPIDMLLLEGAMVGGQDLRPAKSIGSAMQMTAVYIQLQSQQQFGGCSVTHLDTTAVPYIRYSFYKHFKDGIKYVENYEMDFYMTDTEIRNTSVMDKVYMEFPKAQKYAWDMTCKDTYQAIEALMHNLNTLMSRPGSQLPFSSVNLLLDTTKEGRMFSETYLRINIKGLGKLGITSVFPCFIAQLKDGVNRKPGDPNYDLFLLALESSAKRIYPNYVNCDWSVHTGWIAKDREMRTKICEELGKKFYDACINNPGWMIKMRLQVVGNRIVPVDTVDPLEEASTMGCRTQNGYNINAEESIRRNYQAIIDEDFNEKFDGIFSAVQRDGRGNIAPQTIILPEVAMRAKNKFVAEYDDDIIELFFQELDEALNDTCESLKFRFDLIASQDASIAPFMYKNKTMIGYRPEEGIVSALKNGTLAVGMLGMAECLKILIGQDHTTPGGMALADRIINTYNRKVANYKEKYKLNYAVYYSPCESTCYTAMNKFKLRWGDVEDVTEHEYFTNSVHVPVWHECSAFEKIDIESKLTKYGTAGVITYVELESSVQHNIDALETLVNYAMDSDIPYFAVNIKLDQCMDCGWLSEMDDCPICHSNNIRRLRRVNTGCP